jgi:tetratricopeptide (TPR) repeat protein
MDLLKFEGQDLYFDEPMEIRVRALIAAASERYGEGTAEIALLEAYALAPESLTVLVALYRFYYYQHRLSEAVGIAEMALEITARDLGLPRDWLQLGEVRIARTASDSMGLLRFHLLCLKAAAYLKLHLGKKDEGKQMLRKLLELDSHNRLGARQLLNVVETRLKAVA